MKKDRWPIRKATRLKDSGSRSGQLNQFIGGFNFFKKCPLIFTEQFKTRFFLIPKVYFTFRFKLNTAWRHFSRTKTLINRIGKIHEQEVNVTFSSCLVERLSGISAALVEFSVPLANKYFFVIF